MFIRAYLRASTNEQDASRAMAMLDQFAHDNGHAIATSYIENESGTKMNRPELLRLLRDAKKGDIMLVEAIDRLSRLELDDWETLKVSIDSRGVRIVALDLPLTHMAMTAKKADAFTARILDAINQMVIDLMAAIARKDYEQRRQRQAQGIAKAKVAGKYTGRPPNLKLHAKVLDLLAHGYGVRATGRLAGCSATTVMWIRDKQ